MFNCSRCSAVLRPGATFCSQCGLHFEQPVPGYEGTITPLTQQQMTSPTQMSKSRPGIASLISGFMMFAWWLVLAFLLMLAVMLGSQGNITGFWLILPWVPTIWLQRKWQIVHKVLLSTILAAITLGFGIYSRSPAGQAAMIAEQQSQTDQEQQEAEAQDGDNKRGAANQTHTKLAMASPVATQSTDTSVGTQSADEQQLKDLMKSRFGDHLRSVEVTPQHDGGYGIIVAFNAEDNLTTNMVVDGVKIDMKQAYDDLYTSSIDVKQAKMSAYSTLQDKFGKQYEDVVYTTSMDKEVGKQINWDNWPSLDFDQLWTVDFANHSFVN